MKGRRGTLSQLPFSQLHIGQIIAGAWQKPLLNLTNRWAIESWQESHCHNGLTDVLLNSRYSVLSNHKVYTATVAQPTWKKEPNTSPALAMELGRFKMTWPTYQAGAVIYIGLILDTYESVAWLQPLFLSL